MSKKKQKPQDHTTEECLHCAMSLAVKAHMNAHGDETVSNIIGAFTQMLADILLVQNTDQNNRLAALGVLFAASTSQVFRDEVDSNGMQDGTKTSASILSAALHALEDIGKRSGMPATEIAEAQVDSFLRMAVCITLTYGGSHQKFLETAKNMLLMMGDETIPEGTKAN